MFGYLGLIFSHLGAPAGAGGAPAFSPSLDFSDSRNSQYLGLV